MTIALLKEFKKSGDSFQESISIDELEINKGDIILCETMTDSDIILEVLSNNIRTFEVGSVEFNCDPALIIFNDSFSDFKTYELLLSINKIHRSFLKNEILNLLKDLGIVDQKIGKADSYTKKLIFLLISLICRNNLLCINELFDDNSNNNKKIISLIKKISENGALIIKNRNRFPKEIFNRKIVFNEKNELVKDIIIADSNPKAKKEF
ncbi:MAG: hypothetical protein C0601_05175 [Candidatus Muiribacterium halophilum]|uniref:ABC transporter domain-containing protein n=1 Tax=Muiribacterium halophilum TaxID=2053465 RepID=A0A2N5ZIH4_MUIH1|nr:MAG: hypothetical protein C0601_05175 [Candidatus Muirbacterium halophilum]